MDELSLHLPPGFRFHPSDEELIIHYLQNKVNSNPLPASIIAEIDLYRYNPWELPKKALFGESEWYFFSPRDRKYPNGERPNRAAASGYWKATGTDKPILVSSGSKSIGVKKALVFYAGRPPKGCKTDWIMNEYRLIDNMVKPSRMKGSMRLDDWVLCRVRQKGNMTKNTCDVEERTSTESEKNLPKILGAHPKFTDYKADMISDCLNQECQLLAFILGNQALPTMENIQSIGFQGSEQACDFTLVHGADTSKTNTLVTIPSLGNCYIPQKRKPSQEHGYQNLLTSNKKVNNDNGNEALPLTGSQAISDINYFSQNNQNIYNPNPLDPVTNIQELNGLAFRDKYLE